MNLPTAVFVIRWLVRDTLRQARASGLTWLLIGVTLVCTAFCLTLGIRGDRPLLPGRPWEDVNYLPRSEAQKHDPDFVTEAGVDVPSGELSLLFGAFRVPLSRSRVEAVRHIEMLLAGGLADAAGILLALIWTAGFLPTFLEPGVASIVLAKPAPRWLVLAGKLLGVLVFVGFQAFLFIGLTWLALGIRTGVWESSYFIGVPILLTHFAIFFCFSALLAVVTRSTIASVLGTLAIWFACWGVNYWRHAAVAAGDAGAALNTAYWLLPKPADLGMLLADALSAQSLFGQDSVLEAIRRRDDAGLQWSLLTSLIAPLAAFAIAIRKLTRAEY